MSKCILKGINTESIDSNYYPAIKQHYQDFIGALILKGFAREDIRIKFDDENRQIHLDYEPDEIDALVLYTNFEGKLQDDYTRGIFSEGWSGDRYRLWHNKSINDYLANIKLLCKLHADLSNQCEYPHAKWSFSQQTHPYLLPVERKLAIKNAIFELRNENNGQQGIFINELHHHRFPKQFLADNLDFFKNLGVKTLFFEFLLYDRHQALLDTYFRSNSEEIPPELAAYLALKDKSSGCGFQGYTNIVKAAKKAGIRIVAIDSYPSILSFDNTFKRKYLDNDDTIRLKTFNGYAAQIIQKECYGEPYLAFLGFDHGYVCGNSQYKNVKSVAELLPNTCSVFLTDNPINYRLFSPPFFGGAKPVIFEYSKNKEAGADIVEYDWTGIPCKL